VKNPKVTSACKRRLVDVICYKKECHSRERQENILDFYS
jgi:hypothetical protein